MPNSVEADARFYVGVALTSCATLMLQIIQTRILSYVTWYYLAFFVVSLGMFGMTAGAVFVYRCGSRFKKRHVGRRLAEYSAAFALSCAVSVVLQMTLNPTTTRSFLSLVVWVELAVLLAVPFFFSGVVISLALTRSPCRIGRVYGIDLLGAAAGCLLALALLDAADAVSSVLWTAVVSAGGAVVFASSRLVRGIEPPGIGPSVRRRVRWVFVALVAFAVLNEWTPLKLQPVYSKGKTTDGQVFEAWNSLAHVGVHPFRPGRADPDPLDPFSLRQDLILIDGDASSIRYHIRGDVSKALFLKSHISSAAYAIPDLQSAAVIGVGGGKDLITAKLAGVSRVVGVEINPIIVRLLADQPGFSDQQAIADLEGVTIETAEARSWFARSTESFDLIQMSLLDTWASTGAGGFTLSENGLYTVEAWAILLRHLTDGGVLTVTRWYSPGSVIETGRMISLAVASLLENGSPYPRGHLFVVGTDKLATLVMGRSPLSADAIRELRRFAGQGRFNVIASPDSEPQELFALDLLQCQSADEISRVAADYELDISPPTDERPFFFNQLPFSNPSTILRLLKDGPTAGVRSGNIVASATLFLLLLISVGLVAATILIPLRSAARHTGWKLATGGTAFFAAIGAGFMFVEIGLLQRMGILLGHPVHALSVVLFSVILSTGFGSLLSDRWPLRSSSHVAGWALAVFGYLLTLPWWLPAALLPMEGSSLTVRAAVSVAVIAPAGLLMGYGFPTGMRLVSAVDDRPTPWFWGVNGAAGVAASSLAVACSIAFGISWTLVLGGVCYLLVIPAARLIRAARRPQESGP